MSTPAVAVAMAVAGVVLTVFAWDDLVTGDAINNLWPASSQMGCSVNAWRDGKYHLAP